MCKICKDWKSGKIDSKQAFTEIGKALKKSQDSSKQLHLMELSDRILDKDLPVTESNQEADAAWWSSTHKGGEDEG